ncbi:MAG: hypothetical protein IKW38_07515 [Kiritimatiellae bacterium]|nr:hypothetical protein [Kiritimatiellia bacterium]
MRDGCYDKYTTCENCGCETRCYTFVTDCLYDDVHSDGSPVWLCNECVEAYVLSDDEDDDSDDDLVCCGNCGEWVYPDEDDDSCPVCGCNVYM